MDRLEEIKNSVEPQAKLTENGLEPQIVMKDEDYAYLVHQAERAKRYRSLLNTIISEPVIKAPFGHKAIINSIVSKIRHVLDKEEN